MKVTNSSLLTKFRTSSQSDSFGWLHSKTKLHQSNVCSLVSFPPLVCNYARMREGELGKKKHGVWFLRFNPALNLVESVSSVDNLKHD